MVLLLKHGKRDGSFVAYILQQRNRPIFPTFHKEKNALSKVILDQYLLINKITPEGSK